MPLFLLQQSGFYNVRSVSSVQQSKSTTRVRMTPIKLKHTSRRLSSPHHAAAAKSLQSCPTLCDPINGSSPGSAIPGILQARTLEWGAISFSNTSK